MPISTKIMSNKEKKERKNWKRAEQKYTEWKGEKVITEGNEKRENEKEKRALKKW